MTSNKLYDRADNLEFCYEQGRGAAEWTAAHYLLHANGKEHAEQAAWFDRCRGCLRMASESMRADGMSEPGLLAWQTGFNEIFSKTMQTHIDLRAELFE